MIEYTILAPPESDQHFGRTIHLSPALSSQIPLPNLTFIPVSPIIHRVTQHDSRLSSLFGKACTCQNAPIILLSDPGQPT